MARLKVQYFKDDATLASRALQIYLILIGAAHRRETITYQDLATAMGYAKGAGVLADRLGPVMLWCKDRCIPALTAIVVGKTRGTPGTRLVTVEDDNYPAEQQKIFDFPWYSIYPPTIEELGS